MSDAASAHPCPKGTGCALNKGAVHCFHCRRNWPRDETWDMPFEQRLIRESVAAYSYWRTAWRRWMMFLVLVNLALWEALR